MSNSARFIFFFVFIVISDTIIFYLEIPFFFEVPISGFLEKIADDKGEQVFYALAFPIMVIIIFDAIALVLFSKFMMGEEK